MSHSVSEPWRYYSPPLGDEHEYDHQRAVIEAGRLTVEAESCFKKGDALGMWRALSKAQQALLRVLSTEGKKMVKKIGQAKGGECRNERLRINILCIADKLLESGHNYRGLPRKVADVLSEEGIEKSEEAIREILKEHKHELVKI